uniref:cytochrome c oxidase subunit II n=1 Tax=Chuniphyes multidentata TaxID=316200 RepID=UPI0026E257F4|nr:cytochrome c oxidase subunit II [Chuniphyes multidentata]WJJ69922.1 cytochrome c oxidase subunit 2 [Chuniphyes multidentata]
MGFQEAASPSAEAIISFHNHVMVIIVVILSVVVWVVIKIMFSNSFYDKNFIKNEELELGWTLLPIIILITIGIPSLKLLYALDEVIHPQITLHAIGHQWYWHYEYNDLINQTVSFESYMTPTEDLQIGQLRLLEVDRSILLPINTNIRVIVTGADVIHSFTIPSLGFKIDAVPGHLNQIGFLIKRVGIFFGQCSEICGVNHGFMPIKLEAVNLESWILWIQDQIQEKL